MKIIRKLVKTFPGVKDLLEYRTDWKPGHYYSPIPTKEAALNKVERIYNKTTEIKAIDLRDEHQLALFEQLSKFMKESTFRNKEKASTHRFYNGNQHYGNSDALYLESMIRYLKPANIIEAGSGFTSALMMDVNEKYFDNKINLTFIEPYPDRLFSLMTGDDKNNTTVKAQPLESVDINIFKQLASNDILFIDSSHVVKTGSDLHYLFFEILPILNSGVYIHFHDVFNNFEYLPSHFVTTGFGWNEDYFLRAFLMYNSAFEVTIFSNYLDVKHADRLKNIMPDYPINTGAQFWMRKV